MKSFLMILRINLDTCTSFPFRDNVGFFVCFLPEWMNEIFHYHCSYKNVSKYIDLFSFILPRVINVQGEQTLFPCLQAP